MTFREAQAIHEGMRGPFGKWLLTELAKDSTSAREAGSLLIPSTLGEEYEREHLLAKSNALAELLTQIPSKVNDMVKSLQGTSNE